MLTLSLIDAASLLAITALAWGAPYGFETPERGFVFGLPAPGFEGGFDVGQRGHDARAPGPGSSLHAEGNRT